MRGFEAGVHKINYVLSASEAHNLANVRRPVEESLGDFKRIVEERNTRGLKTKVVGVVSENAPAYPATVGYDLATGLGSVNATNLFNAWPRF